MTITRRRLGIWVGVLFLALAGLLMLSIVNRAVAAVPSTPTSGDGIIPELVAGNPNCEDIGYGFGFKIEGNSAADYTGTFTFTSADGILTGGAPEDSGNSVILTSDGTSLDWTSTISLDAVIMKGGPAANVYIYVPEDDGDTGLATPASGPALSHVEFCYDYELDVAKDASTSYTRTYEWGITKEAGATYDLFRGDTQDHKYTVTVDKTGYTDSDWAVTGSIDIDNYTPFDATIESVTDVVSPAIAAAVDCDVTFPYTLPADGSLVCTYGADLDDGTNRTNTATVTTSGVVGGGEATADVAFGDPTTEVNDEVTVTDTNAAFDGPKTVSDDAMWTYEIEFACDADEGTLVNTAKVIGDNDVVLASDTATVTINCYELTVTKDAVVRTYTQEYFWDITKEADATYHLFNGDTQDHAYSVTVTRGGLAAESAIVTGDITVSNAGNPIPAEITGVADVISGTGLTDVNATVSCGVTFPHVIAAGGSLSCTYTATVDDSLYNKNTATATLQNYDYPSVGTATAGGMTDFSGTATFDITSVTPEVVPVTVTDTNAAFDGPKTVSDDAMWTYEIEFACDADEDTLVNTAKVIGDNDVVLASDTATVTINCYELAVTKGADTSLKRTWTWTIDKTADQTELVLSPGQVFFVNYDVTVDATSVDSDWAVSGAITVSNVGNPIPAEITGVADVISGTGLTDVNATVSCGVTFPHVIAAGGSLSCTYTATVDDSLYNKNTATATLQNYDYASDGTAEAGETTDFSGTDDVDFATATVAETDECIDVSDTFAGFLGTACAGDTLPATFTYMRTVGPYSAPDGCGDQLVENTASFETNDTGTTGDDSWTVNVFVPCDVGCTLTPGYWKTHSKYGPAPYDDTWAQIGEDTPFFLSGQSYHDVLWTPPKGGNAYYILAHAYIAAELNQLNGASIPGDVELAFGQATVLFETYTPDEVAALKGKNGKELRDEFISLAETLDDYNNGLTGPGHCSE